MSAITILPASGDLSPAPTKRFRRTFSGRRDTPEALARQAKVTLLAFRAHETREDAVAFLNVEHADLGGRPIDIGARDDAGYAAVEAILLPAAPGAR
ncbi:hypothetical protein ASE86_12355 [Sphingomonas sp. Leaf33]|uniref:hypothetical protein n=1 Tax=Sphingomonas sp. Leaf33 TaxID=1736215 RepID=UPI0006F9A625|nr:hypothetical protein [Sphingomonas sp. Leaf33]KQN19295.1 hypothetical protein ASE86_12355 [Sphingomonas sp. Leaf33]